MKFEFRYNDIYGVDCFTPVPVSRVQPEWVLMWRLFMIDVKGMYIMNHKDITLGEIDDI